MTEIWKIDSHGFVSNGKIFFHVRDLKAITKQDDNGIHLMIPPGIIAFKYDNEPDQAGSFDWFIGLMIKKEITDNAGDWLGTTKPHSQSHNS